MFSIYSYFVHIKPGRLVLWCYLIWYFVTLYYHFDPSPKLWVNSVGISVVIGTALMLSVSASATDYWQTFRLYWMPFAVSSFAALIKNQHYFVIFSQNLGEVLTALGSCGLFLAIVAIVKWSYTSKEWVESNELDGLEREGCNKDLSSRNLLARRSQNP